MKCSNHRTIALTASLLASMLACGTAQAQTDASYPNRSIRMVVPFSAGGPADAMGRLAATGIQQALGQPVVIDNRLGGGGVIGAEAVAKSAPDGYTLLLCNVGDAMAMSLYREPAVQLRARLQAGHTDGVNAVCDRRQPGSTGPNAG